MKFVRIPAAAVLSLAAVVPALADKVVIKGKDGDCFCVDQQDGCAKVRWPTTCGLPPRNGQCPEGCKVDWMAAGGVPGIGPSPHRPTDPRVSISRPACVKPFCPWDNDTWPYAGIVRGLAARGFVISLKDPDTGNLVASAPLGLNGSFQLAPPQPLAKKSYEVCVGERGGRQVCGAPGDPEPALEGGVKVEMVRSAMQRPAPVADR